MENDSEKSSKKDKFIFDTSAFLSLESIYLLDNVLDLFSIITTHSVIRELEDFARYKDHLGLTASRVLSKRNKFSTKDTIITQNLDYVSLTDETLFNLSLKEDVPLITDDLKLLRHTTDKIKRTFSTYFLTNFVYASIISKNEALEKLELMSKTRNWRNNIIYLSTKEELNNLEN